MIMLPSQRNLRSAEPVPTPGELIAELQRHGEVCQEILRVVEREGQALRTGTGGIPEECAVARQTLLPRLNQSLERVRQYRLAWQKWGPIERSQHAEVPHQLQRLQGLIMKIIVLDRENEQSLLRQGLVPARHLPPVQSQQPHYVAELYRRQGSR
jgi:hypothetical protein